MESEAHVDGFPVAISRPTPPGAQPAPRAAGFSVQQRGNDMTQPARNTICLWYERGAEEAARFYAETFPDSAVLGIPCLGLNGGPAFKHSEAFSFKVATVDQVETDRYWNAIVGNGGQESECGWCKDRWGLSWQITPIALTQVFTGADRAAAKRAFDAMMTMKKINVAAIEAARRGP